MSINEWNVVGVADTAAIVDVCSVVSAVTMVDGGIPVAAVKSPRSAIDDDGDNDLNDGGRPRGVWRHTEESV
jgi:hypothetical protein